MNIQDGNENDISLLSNNVITAEWTSVKVLIRLTTYLNKIMTKQLPSTNIKDDHVLTENEEEKTDFAIHKWQEK